MPESHSPTFCEMYGFDVNDIVTYRAMGGEVRRVLVTDVHFVVKNGRPGFDGVLVTDGDATVWGYVDQIVKIGE